MITMKFKIIDRKKTGFAKYCPTFARAYQVMAENLRRRRLVKDLGSRNPGTRKNTVKALRRAVANEKSRQEALEILVKALDDENPYVRRNAAWALEKAAANGVDISAAAGALGKALADKYSNVREDAARALGKAILNEKTREATVRKILEFMDSSWFMREAEKNSDAFINMANALDEVLRRVKAIEAERKVA